VVNGATEDTRPQLTSDDIHRQQRANLALRTLDLEAENIMLQQEVRQLKAKIEELESAAFPAPRSHPSGKAAVQ